MCTLGIGLILTFDFSVLGNLTSRVQKYSTIFIDLSDVTKLKFHLLVILETTRRYFKMETFISTGWNWPRICQIWTKQRQNVSQVSDTKTWNALRKSIEILTSLKVASISMAAPCAIWSLDMKTLKMATDKSRISSSTWNWQHYWYLKTSILWTSLSTSVMHLQEILLALVWPSSF